MAISDSIALGRARKSAGNVTFRVVRGRVIASQKVSGVGTRGDAYYTAAQLQRRAYFALTNRFARMHSASIDLSFEKTRYGSRRNRFFKLNYPHLVAAFGEFVAEGAQDVNMVTDAQIEAAVTAYATANPGTIVRIDRAGLDRVYLAGAWSSIDDPDINVEPFAITSVSVNGKNTGLSANAPGVAWTVAGKTLLVKGTSLGQIDDIRGVAAADGSANSAAIRSYITQRSSTELSITFPGDWNSRFYGIAYRTDPEAASLDQMFFKSADDDWQDPDA